MLRVDLEAKIVTASVRDLIQEPLEMPRPAGMLGGARAALGTDVHRRWRDEREASGDAFRAEVSVSLDHEVDGYQVRLRGRADGVLETDDARLVVEEVKSVDQTAGEMGTNPPADLSDARMQVRLYALCLAHARPEAKVSARLVLVSIVDGTRRELSVPFDATRVETSFERLVRRRIESAEAREARARTKRTLAATLRFPYPEARPHQTEFTDRIADGLEAGRPVLATAPTGVGKTVAALLPALRFALEKNALLFFLTAKTTQQALVADTFVDLAKASGCREGELQALTFRAKRGMCPPGTLLCHPDQCPYLVNFLKRSVREQALALLLDDTAHVTPDAIVSLGEERTICPHALALAACMRVDLVIGDVNYVYDPAVSFSLFEDETQTRDVAVVLDEAHNLFDRAREYYSPFLRRGDVVEQAELARSGALLAPGDEAREPELPGLGAPMHGRTLFDGLAAYLDRLTGAIDALREAARAEPLGSMNGCGLVRGAPGWEAVAEDAASWMVRYAHYQYVHGLVRRDDPLIGALDTVMALRTLLRFEEPEFVPYVAEGAEAPEGEGFGILCVNPANRLEERHRQVCGTVAMSATLEPIRYYADVLGLTPLDPVELSVPSPFPEENRCVAVVPTVSTTWRERRRHYDGIARAIEHVTAVRPGNYVAYFPSFRFLADVRQRLEVDEASLLVQEPRMAPNARARLLDRFREAGDPMLLLAVMGGVFSEGIDLPGEALVGAIVVGPALPQVGFERAVMQHYFDEKSQRGFAYAMLFPGMQRVIQAAGRVHRTPEDRGVIVLLGRRFARSPYVDCLPSHWSRYGPEELLTTDLPSRLSAFWHA